MGKPQKPFIAARIPIGLEEALEKHTKSTGESKTAALINALANYIGWSKEEETKPSASDRLSLLEKRIEKLEKLIQTPQQTNLLELSTVISDDNKIDKKLLDPPKKNQFKSDNKTDNIVIQNIQKTQSDKLEPMTHKEFATLTGMKLETVRSKYKTKQPTVEWQGKTFEPQKDEKAWRWHQIT